MHATMVGMLTLKAFYGAPAIIFLLPITYMFYRVERGRYTADTVPLLVAQVSSKTCRHHNN